MLHAALTLAAKDLRLFVRDRTALLLTFALPIVLATIFGVAMGAFVDDDDALGEIELALEDLDQSARSKALVAEIERSSAVEIKVTTGVRARIAKGKSPAGLLIPAGYGADLAAGLTPKLVLYRDPAKRVEQQVVTGTLMAAVAETAGADIGRAWMKRGMRAYGLPDSMAKNAELWFDELLREKRERDAAATGDGEAALGADFDFAQIAEDVMGLSIEDVTGGNDGSQKAAGAAHSLSGIAVMMLLFGLTACGGTILEEEQQGTLERLRLTPTPASAILLGKLLFTVAVGLTQLIVLFAYGGLVFDIPVLRAPFALAVHATAVACAAAGFGLVFAVVCRSRKQLEGLSTLVILGMSALGGSWFPLMIAPKWFQTVGHFTLNAWAMDGFQGIFWYQKDLGGIAPAVAVLAAIALATTTIAWLVWRRRFGAAS